MKNAPIRLVEPSDPDPFLAFPQLRSIWPPELFKVAREAVIEELAKVGRLGPSAGDGRIFLVMKDDRVIGITGYFINQDIRCQTTETLNYDLYRQEITDIGLRWHGIVPEERHYGYASKAIEMVLIDAIERFPEIITISEYIPITQHGEANIGYFLRMGFTPSGVPVKFDWHPAEWQELSLNIPEFMKERNLIHHHPNEKVKNRHLR